MRNWEPDDDAWVEHARWFPKCPFLLQNRGQEFVTLVQSFDSEDPDDIPPPVTRQNDGSRQNDDVEHLPAARQVFEMGFAWNSIRKAYGKLRKIKTGTNEIIINHEAVLYHLMSFGLWKRLSQEKNNFLHGRVEFSRCIHIRITGGDLE